MELSIETKLQFYIEECISCGCKFGMPIQLKEQRRNNHETFYCPNGHPMVYGGKSDAEKVRDELKRKEAELADQVQARLLAEQETARLARKLKRVHKGTCPCCKRTFQDLQRHMQTKHPELANA